MTLIIRNCLGLFLAVFLFSSCQNEAAQIINAASHSAPVADAGPARTIYLPVSTTILNGSGHSDNGPIVGFLWSMISGPNVPVIQSPGSATTTVSNLIAGTYRFQLMVIDSSGYTGVDTTSVQVFGTVPPVPVTLSLQPATNPLEFLFSGGTGINQSGHAPEVTAGAWTFGGSPYFEHGALRFDLSSIPAGATIISAQLSLYSSLTPHAGDLVNANSGSDNSFFLRRITSDWSAATATWANQPPTTATNQVSVPHTSQAFLDVTGIDVKNLVADMHASGNYGMMMILQNETPYNIRQFYSSYSGAAASKLPKLVVVYQ